MTVTSFGQQDFLLRPNKILPADQEWKDLQNQFNSIPIVKLRTIERELDSIISSTDCYKFLHNADTTKVIAFFLMRKDNSKFDRLIHFGRSVHVHYQPSDKDSVSYLGYVLWGIKYKKNWYYHKDFEDEFWDRSDKHAKSDFLYYVLENVEFFKRKNFWETGGSSKQYAILNNSSSYLKEYAGLPEIVGWHKSFQLRRQNDLLNEKIEKAACQIENDLWTGMHRSNSAVFSSRYRSKYSGESCLIIYSPERDKVLLPIIYYDSKNQPWLTYYYLKISSTDTVIYKWLKFPEKKINRKSGDESLEVVYDIRSLIENWNWGTVNMIRNDLFWLENFSNPDLKQVKTDDHR